MTRRSKLGSERDGENTERKRDNCGASEKLRMWEKERKIARQGREKLRRREKRERKRGVGGERRDVEETVGVGWRWQSEK